MKNHLPVLTVVFLVLAGITLWLANPFGADEGLPVPQPLFGFKTEDVASFRVANFMEGFSFRRDGEDWQVKQVETELAKQLKASDNDVEVSPPAATEEATWAKADPVKIASLLTNIAELRVGEPIASEKDSRALFQINPHSLGVTLYDKDGNELGTLYVGKNGPDFLSSFIARGGEDDVYLSEENLKGLMNYPYEEWLYKTADTTAEPDENVASKKKKKGR